MNVVRTRRSLIAWILYGLVLFSGLVCSIGHGQMLGTFNQMVSGIDCGQAPDTSMVHTDMSAALLMGTSPTSDHAQLMKLAMADCAFASAVALALIVWVGAAWTPRVRRSRIPRADHRLRKPPRYCLPELSPQAP